MRHTYFCHTPHTIVLCPRNDAGKLHKAESLHQTPRVPVWFQNSEIIRSRSPNRVYRYEEEPCDEVEVGHPLPPVWDATSI